MNDEQTNERLISELQEENQELKNKILQAEEEILNYQRHITFLYSQLSKYQGDYT